MFSIGECARHGRISVRMLWHYDSIGLLNTWPDRRDLDRVVEPALGARYTMWSQTQKPSQPRSSAATASSASTRGSASSPNGGISIACFTPLSLTPSEPVVIAALPGSGWRVGPLSVSY